MLIFSPVETNAVGWNYPSRWGVLAHTMHVHRCTYCYVVLATAYCRSITSVQGNTEQYIVIVAAVNC